MVTYPARYEENYYTLDTYIVQDASTDLSDRKLKTIITESESLKAKINSNSFDIHQRKLYKAKLERRLWEMTRNNGVYERSTGEDKLQRLTKKYIEIEEQTLMEQLNNNAYCNLVKREIAARKELEKLIKNQQQELEVVKNLKNSAEEVTEEPMLNERAASYQLDLLELRKKIEAGRLQRDKFMKGVNESKARIKKWEAERAYSELKRKKMADALKRLKDRKDSCQDTLKKLKNFQRVFHQQYNKIEKTFVKLNDKNITNLHKDDTEIQLESEHNAYCEKIDKFHALTKKYCALKEELGQLKQKSTKQSAKSRKQRLLDKGEYNPDAASKIYVEKSQDLKRLANALEEKMEVARKVIGGVKHILFRLHKYDKWGEMGTWYNLEEIAAIDETSVTKTKYSRLLLLMEGKIQSFLDLVVQKVSYMREPDLADATYSEIDPEEAETFILPSGSILACSEFLKEYIKSHSAAPRIPARFRRSTTLVFNESKPISGAPIPKLVDRLRLPQKTLTNTEKHDGITVAMESSRSAKKRLIRKPTMDPYGLDCNFDMLSLNNNILSMYSKSKPLKNVGSASNLQLVTKSAEHENITAKFTSSRVKKKFELARGMAKTERQYEKSGKKAKRVNKLTLKIEKEMANKPPELADIAACTFDALSKFKKSAAELTGYSPTKTKDFMQNSMPNLVSAVVGMKKAKKGEKIEHIANKCRYFPATHKNTKQPQSKLAWEMGRRVSQLKSLKQIGKLPRKNTAFEEFCASEQPSQILLETPRQVPRYKPLYTPRGSGSKDLLVAQQCNKLNTTSIRYSPALGQYGNISETADQSVSAPRKISCRGLGRKLAAGENNDKASIYYATSSKNGIGGNALASRSMHAFNQRK